MRFVRSIAVWRFDQLKGEFLALQKTELTIADEVNGLFAQTGYWTVCHQRSPNLVPMLVGNSNRDHGVDPLEQAF